MSFATMQIDPLFARLRRVGGLATIASRLSLSLLVALLGTAIVLFTVAFAALMVRQINADSQLHTAQHVGQLHKAVTY